MGAAERIVMFVGSRGFADVLRFRRQVIPISATAPKTMGLDRDGGFPRGFFDRRRSTDCE
jgi:hypothetical protein